MCDCLCAAVCAIYIDLCVVVFPRLCVSVCLVVYTLHVFECA